MSEKKIHSLMGLTHHQGEEITGSHVAGRKPKDTGEDDTRESSLGVQGPQWVRQNMRAAVK